MATAVAWKVFLLSTWLMQGNVFAGMEGEADELQAALEEAGSPFTTNPCSVELADVLSTTMATTSTSTTTIGLRGLTSLTELIMAGSTVLNVTGQYGFLIGQDVVVAKGTDHEEVCTIAGFGSIILERPVQFAHPVGTTVEVHLGHSALPEKSRTNVATRSANSTSNVLAHVANHVAVASQLALSQNAVSSNQQAVSLLAACMMILAAIGLLTWHCKGKEKAFNSFPSTSRRTMSNFSRPDAEENRRMTCGASASEMCPLGTPRTPALGGYAVREPGIISVGMNMGSYREDRSGGRFGLVSPSANHGDGQLMPIMA